MKKITPLHVFIILIVSAILIPLLIFGWNELQKEPLEITMNGVKITADGRVFDEGEICIRGAIKKDLFHNTPLLDAKEIRILDKVFPVTNDNSYNLVVLEQEDHTVIYGLVYDPELTRSTSIQIIIPEDESWCIIQIGGQHQEIYYVGSTQANPDYLAILESKED